MTHFEDFDKTTPPDSQKVGLGTERQRDRERSVLERMELEHYWGEEQDDTLAGADGRHKVATLKTISTPAAVANANILYTKDVGGKPETHIMDEDSNDIQITSGGVFGLDASVASKGYQELWGLILQWGNASPAFAGEHDVVFSKPFASACYSVVFCGTGNAFFDFRTGAYIVSIATTKFVYKLLYPASQKLYYLAIGK